jgi:DNA-binding transcriptional MerR regulator
MEREVSDKLYFRIGEVAELTSLNPSVLRYWETEFVQLVPVKSRSGQRLYTKKDIALILEIKTLLHSERLTIIGAKKKIAENRKRLSPENPADSNARILTEVKEELRRFRDLL